MSALRSSRPNFLSIITGIVTATCAVFLFVLPAQAAEGEAYLIVPDMVLGNVEGTEEVFSSLYTELEKQGIPAENIVNFRYDPYDGITEINQQLSQTLTTLEAETGDTEIAVLGYGVGGLIVRNYLESESFRDNIESVVFAATPHEGTIAYTEHIYGKNITYLNAWERLYWRDKWERGRENGSFPDEEGWETEGFPGAEGDLEWKGKDVPMLMKQVLPTNLPLVGVSIEDEALTPLREAVTYSIIDDLKNRELDPESPIKNLQITNLRPSGYRDGWYVTPTRIRTRYSTTNSSVRQQTLERDLVLELERGAGDGYVTKTGASFTEGTTRDYWAKHEEIIHQGIRDVLTGLGLSTTGVSNYHPQSIYDNGNYQYPREYHALGFKVDLTEDIEVESLPDLTFPDTVKYQEEGRVLYFQTTYRTLRSNFTQENPISLSLKSHGRQTIYLSQFLANSRDSISYRFDSFESEVGEDFTFTQTLSPICSGLNENVKCAFNTFEGRNTWTVSSREWIQYPIILVHGILGSFNADMLKPTSEDDPTIASFSDFGIVGLNPTNDIISSSFGERWFTLPVDTSWDRLKSTMEIAGLEQNIDYFQFSYDWRHPNQTSAYNLRNYINNIQNLTGAKKVSVVAHSMGGLVTRAYIEDMANPSVRYSGVNTFEDVSQRVEYENNIARFIMAGTPNMGSGTAIPRWYGGDTLSGNVSREGFTNDYMMQYYLGLIQEDYIESNQSDNPVASEYLKNQVPATRDLLPTYETTMMKKSYEPTLFNPNNFVESWLPRITENVFLDTLNEKSNNEQSNLSGIDTLAMAGKLQETVRSAHFLEENPIITPLSKLFHFWSYWYIELDGKKYWFDEVRKSTEGDGTVLKQSALSIENIENREISLDVEIEHGKLYVQQDFIIPTLEKVYPNYQDQISERIRREYQNALTVNMYSPADIEVTLSDGTIVSQFMNESEMRERGIFYLSQGESENKMLYIPNVTEGEYEVNVKGNGVGEYTLHVQYSEPDNSIIYNRIEGETADGKEESYNFSIEKDEKGKVSEEAITLVPANATPVAGLDKDLYEGIEGDEITFDGSSSTDEDGDTLQYRWTIADEEGNEVMTTEFTENSSYSYTFEEAFTGKITLTVTDGELEEEVASEIVIRAITFGEKVGHIRKLISSLDEDTSYIRAKKRLWLQLIDLLDLPQVENNDRLKEIVIRILERDIARSLIIDNRLERTWMWWRRINLISEKNENVLQEVVRKITQI